MPVKNKRRERFWLTVIAIMMVVFVAVVYLLFYLANQQAQRRHDVYMECDRRPLGTKLTAAPGLQLCSARWTVIPAGWRSGTSYQMAGGRS
jgi:hypothetical protein